MYDWFRDYDKHPQFFIVYLELMLYNYVKTYGFISASRESCMQVKKQQLELDMEQQTGSKSGNEAAYCHPAYLTYMQSKSCEMLGWMKHKLELRLPGEYQ